MRRPSGVADADHAAQRFCRQGFFEVHELPDASADADFPVGHHRNAGRVIAPVFEALQTVEEQWHGILASDVPNDPAHASACLPLPSPVGTSPILA